MSLLYNCQDVSKAYAGSKDLFNGFDLSIFEGDRIGIVGLNGCGKSTLLKVLSGIEKADAGTLSPKKDLKIGYVPQTCDFKDVPVQDVLIDANDTELPLYEKEYAAKKLLTKMGFSGNEPSAFLLSGGWKKRLRIAVELIQSPDLLFLDEPTNHLDLEGILWLEKFLQEEAPTYVLVSHDRYFLQHVTNRIVEIGYQYPGGVFTCDASYKEFLKRKEAFLEAQLKQEKGVASKARRETEWLRAGVKARGTKAQSRIDEAHEILKEHSAIKARNAQRTTTVEFTATERKTRKLLVAKSLGKTLGEKPLFSSLDLTLTPGTRIGLMGPNGSGKTTLLRILADELSPDQGTIKRADDLKIVYFDQHRTQLPDDMTLKEALSPRGDFVTYRGTSIHVNGWCKRFLFQPHELDKPLKSLSGGERARIAIAHLMLHPVDVLFLDEPTNDLDIPTLETLEESLLTFPGAIVLITHDRCMMDRVCTSVLSLSSAEKPIVYADYHQWFAAKEKKKEVKKAPAKTLKGKRAYLNSKEKNALEGKISRLEKKIHDKQKELENPAIADKPPELEKLCSEIGLLETQVEQLYLEWEQLDAKEL